MDESFLNIGEDMLKYEYLEHTILYITILVPEITMYNFSALKEKINSLKLARVSCVRINLEHVETFDSSGFSVLLSFKRLTEANNINLILDNCLPTIIGKLDLLRVSDVFNINCKNPKEN